MCCGLNSRCETELNRQITLKPFKAESGNLKEQGMLMNHRKFQFLILAAILWAGCCSAQNTESWPNRPVSLIVTVAPGTVADILARTLAPMLSERLKQPVVVENRVGASGMIGNDFVAKSAPNGYTLLLMVNSFTMIPSIYRKVPYDTLNDFSAISKLATSGYAFVVNTNVFPAKDLDEFFSLVRASPGKYTYATPGKGTGHHLAMELLKQRQAIDILHVPHANMGSALNNLTGGHAHTMFAPTASVLPQAKAGLLKILAVTGTQRSALAPLVPTYSEFGLSFMNDVDGYWGLMAPAKTPKEIISRLNKEVLAIAEMPDFKQRLSAQDVVVVTSTPEELATTVRADVARWAKVVTEAKITAD